VKRSLRRRSIFVELLTPWRQRCGSAYDQQIAALTQGSGSSRRTKDTNWSTKDLIGQDAACSPNIAGLTVSGHGTPFGVTDESHPFVDQNK